MLPFLQPDFTYRDLKSEIDDAYTRVMSSGRWILGPEVEKFEAAFAEFCRNSFCIGTASGTDAIKIALTALDVGPGDEVIVPANTCFATWLAIAEIGATPVACEPDAQTFNVCAAAIEPLITTRTRAVVPVHHYGIPVDMTPIMALAEQHGFLVVDDASHAHGAVISGRSVGSIGHMTAFSFYPTKNLGAFGDGGAIVTGNDDLASRARQLRNYGSTGRNDFEVLGYNSRLDELQAAFLSAKLQRVDAWNQSRQRNAAIYTAELGDVSNLTLPKAPPGCNPVWHLFVVQADTRNALLEYLAEIGVETAIHYPHPIYRTPPFAQYGPDHDTVSDRLSRRILSLPVGPELRTEDMRKICHAIRRFFA